VTDEKRTSMSQIYQEYVESEFSKGKTSQEIEEEVKSLYVEMNKNFEKNIQDMGDNIRFDVGTFMNNALSQIFTRSYYNGSKYDPANIGYIIETPHKYKSQLINLSYFMYHKMQEFKTVLDYRATMPTYNYVVNPLKYVEGIEEDFIKNLEFLEHYNISHKFNKITKKLFLQDVWFGYEIHDNSYNFMYIELPIEYCNIIGIDRFETYRVAFNFTYFDNYPEQLQNYPEEFTVKYNSYKSSKGKSSPIKELDSSKAIAFKFDEATEYVLPYYTGMFIDLLRLNNLKDVQIIGAISDNYKLLVQKIPMDTKTGKADKYLVNFDDAKEYHANVKSNVPKDVGVVTTPMEIEAVTLKNNVGSHDENIVKSHTANLLNSAGVSSLLFNGDTTSSVGLQYNIQVDENILFRLLRQYETFFRKRLFYFNKRTYKFTFNFLDQTHFNQDKVVERFLKAGQFGFNKFYISSAMGISQLDLINGSKLERALGLHDLLEPLKSSHTSTDEEENKKDDGEEEDKKTSNKSNKGGDEE